MILPFPEFHDFSMMLETLPVVASGKKETSNNPFMPPPRRDMTPCMYLLSALPVAASGEKET